MVKLAVQYLEDSPDLTELAPQDVRSQLHAAFHKIPISMVMLGWHLPEALRDAVVEETERAGALLFRWHPLLTGDGSFFPRPEWQTVGVDGRVIAGFRGLPEFTFVCPNKTAVQDAVLEHLQEALSPSFGGIFLDRIRFPSPAADPFSSLACFCEDCCRSAGERAGLDLRSLQRSLRSFASHSGSAQALSGSLFGQSTSQMPEGLARSLRDFLRFRMDSITGLIRRAEAATSARGMPVGLDCFSPGLAGLVGQDLGALTRHCSWIKVMTYVHVLGPAGLPYELLDLARFLQKYDGLGEADGLAALEKLCDIPIPARFLDLQSHGLSSAALRIEIARAKEQKVSPLFAGLELVEIPGVCELTSRQVTRDWQTVLDSGVDGLVISWDLRLVPVERLGWVSDILSKYA
jgi:hypothetical protein